MLFPGTNGWELDSGGLKRAELCLHLAEYNVSFSRFLIGVRSLKESSLSSESGYVLRGLQMQETRSLVLFLP